jgi:hypothetical protein
MCHFYTFVSPYMEVHTQNVENMWMRAKKKIFAASMVHPKPYLHRIYTNLCGEINIEL